MIVRKKSFRILPSPATVSLQQDRAQYFKTVLENGVRVVSETIPYVKSVSLGIWADVGSRDESDTKNGISHFLEHMVFKGTKNRNTKDIAQSLESLGGYLNAFTTKEQTCFYARVLDAHLSEAMNVLGDLVQNATFKTEDLEKEKHVVIEELKNAEDDPEDIIHDYFEKALYPEHSLGYPIIGTEANVRRFRREDLQEHIAAHYAPSRVIVAAAGNVDHERLVSLVREQLKRLPHERPAMARIPVPPDAVKTARVVHDRPINQAHICLGTVAYSIRHEHRYPLLVVNTLLGEGMSSRLYQNIRERYGFAYSVYSFVNLMSDSGVFGAFIGTDKKNIENSTELILKELNKLKKKLVPRSELERTKSQMKGAMMLGLENMSGRMMRLGSGEMYFEKFTTLDSVIKQIDAVTPEDVQTVANDLFQESRFTTVVIRPS